MRMGDRVPPIDAQRVIPIAALQTDDVVGDFVQRFFPRDGLPTVGGAPHGIAQPVGIVMNILEGVALGAQIPAAEWIRGIAADGDDMIPLDVDFQTAQRFAQMA